MMPLQFSPLEFGHFVNTRIAIKELFVAYVELHISDGINGVPISVAHGFQKTEAPPFLVALTAE